ncbi:MAG: ABC transporter permease [Acidobacteriota bacterium]
MRLHHAELGEFLRIALEALSRYRLRTALSVLGVVLGVAAVIAMMSVSEGARREALAQVESLGLDNLVVRSGPGLDATGVLRLGLTAIDADRVTAIVPSVEATSPVVVRHVRVRRGGRVQNAQALGVRASYQSILDLAAARGRLLAPTDDRASARVCVLGDRLALQIFGFADPIGEQVLVGGDYFQVVGVLRTHGAGARDGGIVAWRDLNLALLVPLRALTGRTVEFTPHQPVDEIWLRLEAGSPIEALAGVVQQTLQRTHSRDQFAIVVPRALLAERYRVQRTFSVVVGSIAVLALVIGGIGIMNIMLTSVVERTREIGVRRTAGATARAITMQFLIETLMMTVGGGALGILLGAVTAVGISWYAGWATLVSPASVALGFAVSLAVGLIFGWYPAVQAAALQPVDAMRHE